MYVHCAACMHMALKYMKVKRVYEIVKVHAAYTIICFGNKSGVIEKVHK